jgi:hypothetical protein
MAAESEQVMLNGGREVGVSLVSGADEFLGALLGGTPAKTGVAALRVVKNAAGQPFVAVTIANKHVGFLSHSDAEDLFPTLAECERRGAVAQVKGSVRVSQDGSGKPVMRISLAEPGQLLGSMETEVSPSPVELPPQQPMPDRPCRTCGKGLPANARFCLECGTPVVAVSVPAEEAAVPTRPVLPVASSVAPLTPAAQPAHPAGAPDRFSSGPAKLSIGSQIVVAIASLLLLIGPFLPWATAGVFSASGLQKTGNEALLLVGLGAIGLAVSAFSLVKQKDSLRFVSLSVGVLGLACSVYYLYALKDQIGESSSGILEVGIGAGIYLCMAASVVVLLAACAVLFGVETRRLTPRAQFSGTPTKGRGWWGRRGGLQKAGVIVGAIVVLLIIIGIAAAVAGGEDKVAVASSSTTAKTSAESSFVNGVLTTPDMIIKITDVKTIPAGAAGNEYGEKPVIAFWYEITNLTGDDLSPREWIYLFSAIQDNDPNVVNELELASLPDDRFRDSQRETIKKGGTVANAVAYELDDKTTPVDLVASEDLGFTETGRMTYNLE